MEKDYLAMIADIEESPSSTYERNEIDEKSPRVVHHPVTPAALLERSRYGSLTRGGLRDALILAARERGWPCSDEDALLCIDASAELGIIVLGGDGLYRVRT